MTEPLIVVVQLLAVLVALIVNGITSYKVGYEEKRDELERDINELRNANAVLHKKLQETRKQFGDNSSR